MSSASNQGNNDKQPPALSPRVARGIALAFLAVIIAFLFTVLVMLAWWGVTWLNGVLFG